METYINLWLDDIRPAPAGWLLAKNYDEAVALASRNPVQKMSLDHDLGACSACLKGRSPEEWLEEADYQSMPNCTHVGTGYNFVEWMAQNNVWPAECPIVHSMNPVGAARMRILIDENWSPPPWAT